MTVGERIYYCRIENHMTQKELGEKTGIDGATIGKYERGVLNPKIGTLRKIAEALDCKLTDLDDSIAAVNSELATEAYRSAVDAETRAKLADISKDLLQAQFGTTDINEIIPAVFTNWYRSLDYADKESIRTAVGHLQHLNSTGKQVAADRLGELRLIEKYTAPEPSEFVSERPTDTAQTAPTAPDNKDPAEK